MSSPLERPIRPPLLDDDDRPGPPPLMSEEPRSSSRVLTVFIALFVLVGFAGVVWYAYDQGRQAGSDATAPLIRADTAPTKARPEQPGGLQVPNQDRLVLDSQRAGSQPTVERLLPPPEQPIIPPPPPMQAAVPPAAVPAAPPPAASVPGASQAAVGTGQAADGIPPARIAPQPDTTAPAGQSLATLPPATTVAPPPPPQQAPQPSAATSPPATPAAQPPRVTAAGTVAPPPAARAPAATPPARTTPGGNFRIQIAALRTEEAALKEWERVKGANRALIGGLQPFVERVDVSGKGTFYRAQGGPLTEDDARAICRDLTAKGQPCLVSRH